MLCETEAGLVKAGCHSNTIWSQEARKETDIYPGAAHFVLILFILFNTCVLPTIYIMTI